MSDMSNDLRTSLGEIVDQALLRMAAELGFTELRRRKQDALDAAKARLTATIEWPAHWAKDEGWPTVDQVDEKLKSRKGGA